MEKPSKSYGGVKKYQFKATFGLVLVHQEKNHKKLWLTQTDFDNFQDQPFLFINHSYTHERKHYLGNPEVDVKKSDEVLMSLFKVKHPYYIYPYGLSNQNLIKSLKENGYKAAFGVAPKVVNVKNVDLFNIPRFGVYDNATILKFKQILSHLEKSKS